MNRHKFPIKNSTRRLTDLVLDGMEGPIEQRTATIRVAHVGGGFDGSNLDELVELDFEEAIRMYEALGEIGRVDKTPE